MDDTKKIIERYKRELMEMSRASNSAKAAAQGGMNGDKGSKAAPDSGHKEKKPQVIGYVEGGSKAYDDFLEELGKMPAAPDNAQKTDNVIVEEAVVEEIVLDEKAVGADEECAPDKAARTPEAPEAPEEVSAVIGLNEKGRAAVSIPEVDAPIFITGPDGSNTEIIDELIPDTIPNGGPLFPQPNYIYIPSTEQVREDVTEQSDPSDNRPSGTVSGVTNNSTNTPRPEQPPTVSVTTPEQAERLGKQPVSGRDPNEQLTGRSFEEVSAPPVPENDMNVNMYQGSRGEPKSFPRTEFKDYEDYQRKNPGKGTIMFRVYTGRQALPLEDAECVIYTRINGKKYEIARMLTNSSGQTPLQGLAAPNKELSQHYENEIQAFALYDATVTKNGFSQVVLEDIPVFDGVMSVQKVFMIVSSR